MTAETLIRVTPTASVKMRLTRTGQAKLNAYTDPRQLQADGEGFHTLPFWEFAAIFGPLTSMSTEFSEYFVNGEVFFVHS